MLTFDTSQRLVWIGERLRAQHVGEHTKAQIVAMLLLGEVTLFGKRVEVTWPDGLPDGFTEESLRDFGRSMLEEPNDV